MKLFCQKCANPTTFTDIRPAFCASCGNPFVKIDLSNSTASSPPKTFKSKPKPAPIEAEEEFEDEEHQKLDPADVPKLEIEIIPNLRNRVSLQTLGNDKSPKQELQREKPKKQKFKDFERQWADELKSSKGKKSSDLDE